MSITIEQRLTALYGPSLGPSTARRLQERIQRHTPDRPAPFTPLCERDVFLIAYGDQVRDPMLTPLAALAQFSLQRLNDLISCIHLLPFFPSSSDDGFSVLDYTAVDPALGDWNDISQFTTRFDLMFDAVFNHVSAQSDWFKRFLAGDPEFRDFFVAVQGQPDLSAVVRPRALPLLTNFPSSSGPLQVWTTFSADQVDLNFKNPEVFLRTVDVLLTYVARGARFIRLDAVAYLWKELGTPCIHRLQTHRIIQLWRAILDQVAPGVQLITETNVPHLENVSYFGDGNSEAQLVYNFALPPLVLHTLRQQNSTALTQWARGLRLPSDRVAFFNFLASHDGIGLNPARGILGTEDINQLVADIQALGGFVSYKHNSNGTRSPYELNVNYYDALALPTDQHNPALPITRFSTAHSIMLSLRGVPGIYFHSLVGSMGDRAGADATNIPRRINRQKLERSSLETDLERSDSLRHKVFRSFRRLLRARRHHTAFSPFAPQEILEVDPRAFVLRRGSVHSRNEVWCLHNVSNTPLELTLPATFVQNVPDPIDLLSGARLARSTRVCLDPCQTLWLTPGSPPTAHTRPTTA